jgi:hypothetical protein
MPAQNITVTATFKQAPPNTHSISGTVSGDVQQGVVVSVDATHSATTDASGNYTISGLSDGTYTVTPILAGYTFAPATASATVSGADVTGVNFTSTGGNVLVAVDDSYLLAVDTVLTVAVPDGVLSNDVDSTPNVILTAKKVTDPQNGILVFNSDGSFTYTPNTGFIGTDQFTYSANNGQIDSNIATVTLSVGVSPMKKVTLGVTVEISTTDLGHAGEKFDKSPKIFCSVNSGGKQKKAALKKVKMPAGEIAKGIWMKKISLYNKKSLKGGYSKVLNGTLVQEQKVQLKVKGSVNGTKYKELNAIEVLLVPPEISNVIVKPGALEISGKYFGIKAPKVALEPEKGGKLLKLKVDKKSLQADDPENCSVKVSFKAEKVPAGRYYLILDNKIGIGVDSTNNLYIIDIQ